MHRRPLDDQETPADHWKNRTVQHVKRVPGFTDLRRGEAGSAKRGRMRNVALRFTLMATFAACALGVGWLAWDYAGTGADRPVRPVVVKFEADGRLDREWLDKTIDFSAPQPLARIKETLEAEPQVREAVVTRSPDESISVKLSERSPVARLLVRLPDGSTEARLVATDGVVFRGVNVGPMLFANLPLLEGAKPRLSGVPERLRIEGFEPVAGFLVRARERHASLYREWLRVSLRDYPGRPDAPGAVIRVKPRLNTQAPDSAAIVEVLFSPQSERYAVELNDLDYNLRQWVAAKLRDTDRARFPLYILDMSIWNLSNSRRPYPEPRLIPVTSRQP